MEMSTFAVENGYAEAIIRGFRASFFNETQYTQIRNCSTLDELKSVFMGWFLVPVRHRLR